MKNSRLWIYLRKKKSQFLEHLNYRKAMSMPLTEYENYIKSRYSLFMNRFEYSKGITMDFDNPITFSQKLQWLMLYDQNELKTICADKYEVRKIVEKVMGKKFLVPLIKINGCEVFNSTKEIDFNQLPESFVIKCTHGSHMNIIIKNKSKLSKKNIKAIKRQLQKWLKIDYTFSVCIETQYHNIRPRLIIEQYIQGNNDIPDYKIFCFNGNPSFLWVDTGRFNNHKRSFFDLEFNPLPFKFEDYEFDNNVKVPVNFKEMINYSKIFSKDFLFVRCDYYETDDGKLFFGELTFSSCAGLSAPQPIEYDLKIGQMLKINKTKRENNFTYRKK